MNYTHGICNRCGDLHLANNLRYNREGEALCDWCYIDGVDLSGLIPSKPVKITHLSAIDIEQQKSRDMVARWKADRFKKEETFILQHIFIFSVLVFIGFLIGRI